MASGDKGQGKAAHRPHGIEYLRDPALNKGTAFTEEERDALGLRGLLPPRISTQDEQEKRILENFARKPSDLEKYIFLIGLQDRNERMFYRTVIDNIETMMPIIYTPTVGEACMKFGHILRRPRGLYLTVNDRGRLAELMRNWPHRDVDIIVVTDGQRILGLGDLGANGMGIPIGKLSLYTACAGVDPGRCLPIMLDVGTDNEELLNDPLYIGTLQRRLHGPDYDALVEEFMAAAEEVFPDVLIQFEDFGTRNAFRLLDKYRDRYCVFNDDIQGTAAVTLAGLYSAMRMIDGRLADQKILFLGAGEAAIGIANLIVAAMVAEGVPEKAARERCWFVDSRGLVVERREHLQEHKRLYAHDSAFLPDLASAVESLKPTALIGVSGQPQTFTQGVIERMAEFNERPLVLALSNPTSKAECTAEQAYAWSQGRAIFASGSPFAKVAFEGRTYQPGQSNNAYIFPGLGLGLIACRARRVVDEMFYVAAKSLAEQTGDDDLAAGCLFPPLTAIRRVSEAIAVRVAQVAYAQDLAVTPRPDDLPAHIRGIMYSPEYESFV